MAIVLGQVALAPGGIIAWLLVGLIAGWFTGLVMQGGGYGILGDLVLGLIGALIGGFLVCFFVQGDAGFWGSIVVALIGSVLLVAIARALSGPRAVV
jgi:uncharacterized membrane protein YeaQ/YmgE (transglycosylase-associated protein family)